MKRSLIAAVDLAIIGLILFFIIHYANTKMHESNENQVEAFEKMTVSAEQTITNYLEDEQHLCDIWANYINRSAQAGTPMTSEEAISFIKKAKISPEIYGHLIFLDDSSKKGISTHPSVSDPNDYSVSYGNINLFENREKISREVGVVSLTRAYTNPQNGIQSIAFMNYVNVLDEASGALKEALLMRVEPVSVLEDKFVFLKGEYESVEISLINREGDYLVHGKSLKNSNFFEYFRSYNRLDIADYNEMTKRVTSESGTMTMQNSKGEECVISYTPLRSVDDWFLLAYIPKNDLAANTVVDWLLLGTVILGLSVLIIFNYLVLRSYNIRLTAAAKAANQANEAKSHFLSIMSHDIRTPMNAILGLNEMVLRESREEETLNYSESIRTAGNTLLSLINDILDFSRIEAGRMEIINVDYSFVSMVNDLVNMVSGRAQDKGLKFDLDVDRNIPMILNGDEIRVKQVITNILTNAVKYTKEGSITFKAGFEKEESKNDSIRLFISVTDTGIGIKAEDMKRMFQAFERIDEIENRSIEGTGLGMSIAQSFLNLMGSHIEVESEYGKGSTFSFALVQDVKDWKPIGDFEEAFKKSLSDRKKYRARFTAPDARILVVDDAPVNLSVFESLLKYTKVRIDKALSGDEGISFYRREHYDVIFLDHMMPDKDGIETLLEMKEISDSPNNGTPVICLTANAISGMREMYIREGFDDYITKPVDPDRLELMLLHYLPKDKIASAKESEVNEEKDIPDFIFRIGGLDVDAGLKQCRSSETYLDTLKVYLDSAKGNADEIEKYWDDRDIKNTTIKIHALKSSSRVIGALGLGDLAEKLENAGETGDVKTLEDETGELLSQYRKLAKALEPLNDIRDDGGAKEKPLISKRDLKEAYEALSSFCAAYEYDSVVNIMESLKDYSFPEDEHTRFEALKKAVLNFDYEEIPTILTGGEK